MRSVLPIFKKSLSGTQKGFTLIELLVVIAIIASLAIVVFVALNPGGRLRDSRDARRTADVDSILTAIHQSIVDNKGALPTGMTTSMAETQLGSAVSGCAVATGTCAVVAAACLDLTTPLAKYLKSIPIDPSLASNSTKTDYSVAVDANNIITVKACGVENLTSVSSSR